MNNRQKQQENSLKIIGWATIGMLVILGIEFIIKHF